MNIKSEGYTITGAPGIEYIKVEHSEKSDGGVHVAVKFDCQGPHDPPISFGLVELADLVAALEEGRQLAWSMSNGHDLQS